MSSPHLLHLTSVGAVIFQFALLLSLLPLEDLFLGQMDISNTSHPNQFSVNTQVILYSLMFFLVKSFLYIIVIIVTVIHRRLIPRGHLLLNGRCRLFGYKRLRGYERLRRCCRLLGYKRLRGCCRRLG